MIKLILLGILIVCFGSCVIVSGVSGKNKNLIFLGTVISIESSTLENSYLNWVVTVNVDRIVLGSFSGETFQFRIHSPAISGIKEKEQYVVEAVQIRGGYTVDPNQWPRDKRKLPQSPNDEELKEIGRAIISSLEEWVDEPNFRLIDTLKASEFKPFLEQDYIANWKLSEDRHSLYCYIGGSENLRFSLYVQLKKIRGKWVVMAPLVEKTWRVRTK